MQKKGGEFLVMLAICSALCFELQNFLPLPFSSWGIIFHLLRRHTFFSIIFDEGREKEHACTKEILFEGCEYFVLYSFKIQGHFASL